MELELILIIVIVGVLVIDLIINARKKTSVDESVKKISSTEESKSKSKFSFDFITKRKRNIVSFIILTHIFKLLTHFYFYKSIAFEGRYSPLFRRNPDPIDLQSRSLVSPVPAEREYLETRYFDFVWHIENIYNNELWLFIPSFIILVVIVWLFNDRIKIR